MSFDKVDLDRLQAALHSGPHRFQSVPTRQKLRSFTVICLILNRTIGKGSRKTQAIDETCDMLRIVLLTSLGSGIFVTPGLVLRGTNSVGVSLLLWPLGGIVATAGVLVWLEFGLSTPRQEVQPGVNESVPRSGGEKNYVSRGEVS